jgi:3-oxoacyl-ACP reductase-like protein
LSWLSEKQSRESTVMAKGGARPGAGRKRGKVSKAKRALAEMAKEHAEAALRTLVEIATRDGAASARVSAATAILDRAYGKPSQAVDLSDSSVGQHIIVSWKDEALPDGPKPE